MIFVNNRVFKTFLTLFYYTINSKKLNKQEVH